ncbi:hypothetical protein SeMB42_g03478 [Synchytrium endobioticum]|uniref:Mediator of RNA polymerase II transcription subunit 9 n=1 Tax=Synchytrium endobioticum TaxID=286115 RepID=A0A507DFG6_9FUNG|nr:hypothetical protein SeMB42_g03478 [Synchytrium endobioticum]TPX50286.1 hypothetical protein SeLEV6574_g00986 [Synchytrium endobioticum]
MAAPQDPPSSTLSDTTHRQPSREDFTFLPLFTDIVTQYSAPNGPDTEQVKKLALTIKTRFHRANETINGLTNLDMSRDAQMQCYERSLAILAEKKLQLEKYVASVSEI